MSSPASLLAVSCTAAGTTCAWPSRPTWSTSRKRLGLRQSDTGPDIQAWLESTRNFWSVFLPQLLEDPGC